jgi:glycosyltransferase involved in cell wall biosynthesis
MQVFQRFGGVKLLVVADKPPHFQLLPASRVEFEPWSPSNEVAAFARMSIGLMPLAETEWCNGKCSYKMLCYMAAGLPVVVTPAGMNLEVLAMGLVGFGARRELEWVEALSTLLEDATLRRRMGAAGRDVIEQHFSLQRLAQQYAVLFRSLTPGPRTNTSPMLLRPVLNQDRQPKKRSIRRYAL